jgi:GNAT superfamily N-acetyltransferase
MNVISLGIEHDNKGELLEIKKVDSIAHSPIYTFFLRQQADLMDSGYSYPSTSWEDKNCGAIYAERQGKILGHIVYDNHRYPGASWIVLSAVDQSHRNKGIYKILHDYFEKNAIYQGCWYIASHIHVKNSIRLKSAEKVGMVPTFYLMSKKLT